MRPTRLKKWKLPIFLAVVLSASLAACGQKGPLLLPPVDTAPMPVTPQTFPEPETDEPESERAPLGILPGSLPTLP